MRHGAFGVIKMGVGKHDPATTPPRIYAAVKGGGAIVVSEAYAQHFKGNGFAVEPITATAREAGWVQRFLRPEKADPPVTVNTGSPLWLLTCVGGRSAVIKDESGRRCGAPRGLAQVPGTEALSSGEMTGAELKQEVSEEYPQGESGWTELTALGGTAGTGLEIGGAVEFAAPGFPPGAGGEGESPGGGGSGGFIPAGMAPQEVEDASRSFAFYKEIETRNTDLKAYLAATKTVPYQSDASVLHRTDIALVEYAQPIALLESNGWGSANRMRRDKSRDSFGNPLIIKGTVIMVVVGSVAAALIVVAREVVNFQEARNEIIMQQLKHCTEAMAILENPDSTVLAKKAASGLLKACKRPVGSGGAGADALDALKPVAFAGVGIAALWLLSSVIGGGITAAGPSGQRAQRKQRQGTQSTDLLQQAIDQVE
jgi:hypothetical protein